MTNIENYIASGDLTSAYSLASTCPTANPQYDIPTGVLIADSSGATHVVANYLKFYKILIHCLDGTISDAEKDTLTAMAGLCPILNGMVVYQARTLYAIVFNTANTFTDASCDVSGSKKSSSTKNNKSYQQSQPENTLLQQQKYSVYPNPNNGNILLLQRVIDEDRVKLEVINTLAQTVYKGELYFKGGKVQLNLQNNAPGLYVVQLTDSKSNSFILKFVISQK